MRLMSLMVETLKETHKKQRKKTYRSYGAKYEPVIVIR